MLDDNLKNKLHFSIVLKTVTHNIKINRLHYSDCSFSPQIEILGNYCFHSINIIIKIYWKHLIFS